MKKKELKKENNRLRESIYSISTEGYETDHKMELYKRAYEAKCEETECITALHKYEIDVLNDTVHYYANMAGKLNTELYEERERNK